MKKAITWAPLRGTENQIAWAQEIRVRVNAEFTRVAEAFAVVAAGQTGQNQADTAAIIAILEEKRAAVMSNESAGYFIHDWDELRDQVRHMVADDKRCKAIKAAKAARA